MSGKKLTETLPPVPPTLKPVAPYVQRADELRAKDPVMAYWCMYYAAQLGLDLKSHEPGARDYLYALITALENMKKEIGPNDAIDVEAAGAAYVENFALKVFAMADNEDRKGEATRSTAKKFLAAANFLELLRVFEKTNLAQVNEEKVRYAKWKASDIAKAFREGRKPKPGPANDEEEVPEASLSAPSATESPPVQTPNDLPTQVQPPIINVDAPAPGTTALTRTPPHTPPRKLKAIPHDLNVPPPDILSPGNWSTVATPGSVAPDFDSPAGGYSLGAAAGQWSDSPLKDKTSSVISKDTFNASGSTLVDNTSGLSLPTKKVHFTPSTTGGLSSVDSSPVTSPQRPSHEAPPTQPFVPPRSAPQDIPGARGQPRVDPASQPLPDSSPSASSRTSLDTSPRSGGHARLGSSPPSSTHTGSRFGASPPKASAPPAAPQPGQGRARRSSKASPPQAPSTRLPPAVPPPPPPQVNASYPNAPPVHGLPSNQYPASNPGFSGSPDRAPVVIPPPVLPQGSSNLSSSSSSHSRSGSASYAPYTGPASNSTPSPPQLTIQMIAKAQKHCRFAISALEYEDAEQARKELRAALAVLGDR